MVLKEYKKLVRFGLITAFSFLMYSCSNNDLVCKEDVMQNNCIKQLDLDSVQILGIGEKHTDLRKGLGGSNRNGRSFLEYNNVEDDLYLIYNLPYLKKQGFTHLFVELSSSDQILLDQYFNGEIDAIDLDAQITKGSGMGGRPPHLISAIIRANELGYIVKAVSQYTNEEENLFNRISHEYDYINTTMIENTNAKIIYYGGLAHPGYCSFDEGDCLGTLVSEEYSYHSVALDVGDDILFDSQIDLNDWYPNPTFNIGGFGYFTLPCEYIPRSENGCTPDSILKEFDALN